MKPREACHSVGAVHANCARVLKAGGASRQKRRARPRKAPVFADMLAQYAADHSILFVEAVSIPSSEHAQ